MKPYIVGAGTYRSGEPMCVATDRTHNTVHLFDGTSWQEVARWTGHEVTAACVCSDVIVCPALDQLAYLIQGTTVSKIALPKEAEWIYGAAAMSEDLALLGGAGGLV